MEIKQWSDFFKINESVDDEGNTIGREYQILWISNNLNNLSDDEIQEIYELMDGSLNN